MFPQNLENEKGKIIPIDFLDGSLTPDKLRIYKGFENITDDDAKEIIFTYQRFAALVFEFLKELEKKKERGEIQDITQFLNDNGFLENNNYNFNKLKLAA